VAAIEKVEHSLLILRFAVYFTIDEARHSGFDSQLQLRKREKLILGPKTPITIEL